MGLFLFQHSQSTWKECQARNPMQNSSADPLPAAWTAYHILCYIILYYMSCCQLPLRASPGMPLALGSSLSELPPPLHLSPAPSSLSCPFLDGSISLSTSCLGDVIFMGVSCLSGSISSSLSGHMLMSAQFSYYYAIPYYSNVYDDRLGYTILYHIMCYCIILYYTIVTTL